MADTCDGIFADQRLASMNLRYFDPTLSAAGGHEDKGLIECLRWSNAPRYSFTAQARGRAMERMLKPRWR